MKRISIRVLQGLILLCGVGVALFLLLEPNVEGRNVHATLFEVYFNDPFLAYAYGASVPFFVALFQAFKFLGYVRRGELVSPHSVRAVRIIRRCAVVMVGFITVGVAWLLISESDDRPPVMLMGVIATAISVAVAIVAAKVESSILE